MSVFLEREPASYIAENDLAFAIWDAYPVSAGHALVVTKRVVPTWFDATVEERAAVCELVDVVRRRIARDHAPDGFNVGFNAGAAAGQTVMHLHVHVIPRYRGDVSDRTGGVRGVIPGMAKYDTARST